MLLKEINGNEHITDRLRAAARTGKISHAYLFEGDATVDKQALAEAFIKAILCREAPGEGCESCITCRKIDHKNYADIIHISASGNPSIKDAVIETLQGRLAKKPCEGDRNFVVICDADTMTLRAQNRLLKTLEEPSGASVLILLSENTENLLQTVLSRCTVFRFAACGSLINDGRREDAAALIRDVQNGEPFFFLKKRLEEMASGDGKGKSWSRGDAMCLLDTMEQIYGTMAQQDVRNAQHYGRAVRYIEEARRDILQNVNVGYALKNMIIKIGGIKEW